MSEPLPPIIHCAVCGHAQAGGRLCEQCGLALHPAITSAGPSPRRRVRAVPDAEPEKVRCGQCGVYSLARRCPGCGILLRPADEV